jgi:CRP/FNR family transcriptional regulator, cyclic AMP receptor protein
MTRAVTEADIRQGASLMSRVSLLDVEPALGAHLDPEQFQEARSASMVSVVGVPRGNWRSHGSSEVGGGFMVIRGLLTRRLGIGDRRGAELLGRGDVIYPACPPDERMVVSTTSWRVEKTALLAVLDERFHGATAPWPRLVVALHERSAARSHSLLVRLAIAEHPQIVRRVHLMLWHLADRWGRPEDDGTFLPLKISRATLGDLVCSTRESVSRSLAELERRGDVQVRGNGYFLRFPAQGDEV